MGANVGGSSVDAKTAATKHIEWVKALGGNYQIGAPGVARGGKKWMTVSPLYPMILAQTTTLTACRTGSQRVAGSVNTISSRSTFTGPAPMI
jgi:hypothetical protein